MNMFKITVVAATACLMISACSETTPGSETTETEKAEVPAPNFKGKEGTNYIYVAAVSEDDKAAGKATGDVVMIRYMGEKDGMHTVELVDDDESALVSAECANPCQFVKMRAGPKVERVEFSPDSLVGAAFEDAFAGHLEVAKRS
jgi:hypothetical protein